MKRLRPIVVNERQYLWRYATDRERSTEGADDSNVVFIAYLAGYKRAPLRVRITTWTSGVSGCPLNWGGPITLDDAETLRVNLNEPKWAASLIREALRCGWNPADDAKPFVIDDGVGLLRAVAFSAEILYSA